ncbi:MAG TPA: hypothetical protein VFI70_00930 [Nitrososphaeraceae archaeon]|nr:hypothetical protein [Nitrososphaeraceae archaeon]
MSNNNNTNDYNKREGRVLELYDQGKTHRQSHYSSKFCPEQ